MTASPTAALAQLPGVPLAHAGEGATWQALLTVVAIGIAIVFVLVLFGRVPLDTPGDLVLPLAAVAIVASLAPVVSGVLSDWVGYAVPVGLILLLVLVLAAVTEVALDPAAPLAVGAVALAVVAALALGGTLNDRWHPDPPALPVSDDATIEITSPEDGATVVAGPLAIEVAVEGGSIGPTDLGAGQATDDPEELAHVRIFVDGERIETEPAEACTVEAPCTEATYVVELTAGDHLVLVELVRWDGTPLTPNVTDRIEVRAG